MLLRRASSKCVRCRTRTRRNFVTTEAKPPSLVSVERRDTFGVLKLNRPKVNAINPALLTDLRSGLKELENDKKIKGAILTSALPGVFSGGLDLIGLSELSRDQIHDFWKLFSLTLADLVDSRLIIVSAINGHCPAGGLVLSLATDYRIIANGDYKAGVNEVAVGVRVPPKVIELGSSVAGTRNSHFAFLTGTLFHIEEAHRLNFIDKIVPQNDLIPFSEKFLSQWISGVTFAVEETKKRTRSDFVKAVHRDMEVDAKLFTEDWFSEGTQKLLHEFKEKMKSKKK